MWSRKNRLLKCTKLQFFQVQEPLTPIRYHNIISKLNNLKILTETPNYHKNRGFHKGIWIYLPYSQNDGHFLCLQSGCFIYQETVTNFPHLKCSRDTNTAHHKMITLYVIRYMCRDLLLIYVSGYPGPMKMSYLEWCQSVVCIPITCHVVYFIN